MKGIDIIRNELAQGIAAEVIGAGVSVLRSRRANVALFVYFDQAWQVKVKNVAAFEVEIELFDEKLASVAYAKVAL